MLSSNLLWHHSEGQMDTLKSTQQQVMLGMCNQSLIMKKRQTDLQWETSYFLKELGEPLFFYNVNVIKTQNGCEKCSRLKETKEI